jgi:hypothetical protein
MPQTVGAGPVAIGGGRGSRRMTDTEQRASLYEIILRREHPSGSAIRTLDTWVTIRHPVG